MSKSPRLKVHVDQDKCQGHARCKSLAPELFELDEFGNAHEIGDGTVPEGLVKERLNELSELQDSITAARREALIGTTVDVLVDGPGVARSHREAPEIDGIIAVSDTLAPGTFHDVVIVDAFGPDLEGAPA